MNIRPRYTAFDYEHLMSDTKELRVLLVEDDPATRWIVRKSLKNECLFATADHVAKAIELYMSFNPHLVFLDIQLPDGTGYEVLDWIKICNPDAYVVMFSSHNTIDNIMRADENGASGFIPKPFSKQSLLHYVRSHTHAGQTE